MKRVLIATDGSAAASEAVRIGVELARDEGAEAIFVHVVTTADMVAMNGFGLMGYVPNEETTWDEHVLDDARAVAEGEGVLLGSVSRGISGRSKRPVLVVRAAAVPEPSVV